jgi:regulatory protein
VTAQSKEIITPGVAFKRLSNWCALQERSQFETVRKLATMGIHGAEAEALVAKLISENFLSEERFAEAFARGKFRMKGWGKKKIRAALQTHRISKRNIEEALKKLDEDLYSKAIELAIEKKLMTLGLTDRRTKYFKTLSFVTGKGFETELVSEVLNRVIGEQGDEFRT